MLDGHVVPEADDQDRQGEGGAQGGCLDQLGPPARHGDQDVHQRGQDEDLADLADRGRGPQGQPRGQHHPQPGPRLPEQDDQARHDQGLERRVGHDRLLDLELVGIQQDGGGGQGGQPARHAAAAQDEIERDGHGQAEQVLDGHHHGQRADPEEDLEGQLVPGRIVSRVRPEQVLDGVDEQQGRAGRPAAPASAAPGRRPAGWPAASSAGSPRPRPAQRCPASPRLSRLVQLPWPPRKLFVSITELLVMRGRSLACTLAPGPRWRGRSIGWDRDP